MVRRGNRNQSAACQLEATPGPMPLPGAAPASLAVAPSPHDGYRRLNAHVLARPIGMLRHGRLPDRRRGASARMGGARLPLADAPGGLRLYTDDAHRPGERLELEILLADGEVTVVAEVAWVDALGPAAPARFDVGVAYVEVRSEDLARIEHVLAD